MCMHVDAKQRLAICLAILSNTCSVGAAVAVRHVPFEALLYLREIRYTQMCPISFKDNEMQISERDTNAMFASFPSRMSDFKDPQYSDFCTTWSDWFHNSDIYLSALSRVRRSDLEPH